MAIVQDAIQSLIIMKHIKEIINMNHTAHLASLEITREVYFLELTTKQILSRIKNNLADYYHNYHYQNLKHLIHNMP